MGPLLETIKRNRHGALYIVRRFTTVKTHRRHRTVGMIVSQLTSDVSSVLVRGARVTEMSWREKFAAPPGGPDSPRDRTPTPHIKVCLLSHRTVPNGAGNHRAARSPPGEGRFVSRLDPEPAPTYNGPGLIRMMTPLRLPQRRIEPLRIERPPENSRATCNLHARLPFKNFFDAVQPH